MQVTENNGKVWSHCPYCFMNTSGQHMWNCPLNPNSWHKEQERKIKIQIELDTTDGTLKEH